MSDLHAWNYSPFDSKESKNGSAVKWWQSTRWIAYSWTWKGGYFWGCISVFGKVKIILFVLVEKRYFSQNTLKPKEDKKEEKPATEEKPKAEKNEDDEDGIDDSKLKTLKKSQKVAEIGGKPDKNKKPKKKSKMKGVKNKALLSFDE